MTQMQSPRTSNAGIGALFDLSFTRFITVWIIKFVYLLAMAGLALGWLGVVIAGFAQGGFMGGVLAVIVATIVAVLYLLIIRIGLELVVVIFRMGQNIDRLANGPVATSGFPVTPVV